MTVSPFLAYFDIGLKYGVRCVHGGEYVKSEIGCENGASIQFIAFVVLIKCFSHYTLD